MPEKVQQSFRQIYHHCYAPIKSLFTYQVDFWYIVFDEVAKSYTKQCRRYQTMWTVEDRYGNSVYMTKERWEHILESRPELEPYLDSFLETLKMGRREQDPLSPNEYRYFMRVDELQPENNHLIMIVIFKTKLDETGQYVPNNFVVTGWANYIWSQ